MSENVNTVIEKVTSTSLNKCDDEFKLKAGIFLTAVTGISALIGFGTTIMYVKKQDPRYFNKGITGSIEMTETGASLALRALGWGSLYAVTGCSIICFTIWKISGAKNFQEFRCKIGSALPRITKTHQEGRTEFSGMNDLLDYLSRQKSKKDA